MENKILFQFEGFLNTPQIWKKKYAPYTLYNLEPLPLSKLTAKLNIPPTMVLGKRMEMFFKYYVTHFSHEEILAHNEQIIFEKKTLGELDFLLKNSETGKISHVELVYKFYLFDPEISGDNAKWIGPNRRDSFPKKIERLKNRQFPLLHRKETLPLLKSLEIDSREIVQKLCFKAHLFLPKKWMEKRDFKEINPETISGFWIRASEFTKESFGKAVFFSPKKQDWPIHPRHNDTWLNFEEINPQISDLLRRKQSPLVWMKTEEGSFHRFFIVWW